MIHPFKVDDREFAIKVLEDSKAMFYDKCAAIDFIIKDTEQKWKKNREEYRKILNPGAYMDGIYPLW